MLLLLVVLALWAGVVLVVLALCGAAARAPSQPAEEPPAEAQPSEDEPVAAGVAAPD